MLFDKNNAAKIVPKTAKSVALLVNDNLLAETVLLNMQKRGFYVDVYAHCEELENIIQNTGMFPDVLVFDMDAFDSKNFQCFFEDEKTKLIGLSSHQDMDTRLQAVRAKVSCFLTKPVNVERLARKINDTLALKMQKVHSVLVIDDSILNIKLYQHILEPQGIRVRFVKNPMDTLNELEHHLPYLVLIDYNLATVNSVDMLKVIRQVYSALELPVVFVEVENDPEFLSEVRNQKALETIHK